MKLFISLCLFVSFFTFISTASGQTSSTEQNEGNAPDTARQNEAPVVLGAFKLYKSGNNQITITWTTVKEENNEFFRLERSANGVDFSTIALLRGSNRSNTYTIIDDQPFSNRTSFSNYNYYRLTCTDKNGKVAYFDVLKVLLKGVPGVLNITPNPVKDQMQIQLRGEEKGLVTVSIMTSNGLLVKQWVLLKEEELMQQTVSLSDLQTGNYILQTKIRLMVEAQQFVKN
ncbi:MAG: T9SS type A sorting domain-containing protein [Chitinophagaceae bacterium]|nr:T9SS type A sorting domain-containing protein [Chitinophagaceae bacterium]